MLFYLLKRILFFIPIFFVISLIAFGLSQLVPGDPVLELMQGSESQVKTFVDVESRNRTYKNIARRIGADLPLFYCSITTAAVPDTLHRILRQDHRSTLKKLVAQYGNWQAIEKYYHHIQKAEEEMLSVADSIKQTNAFSNTRTALLELYIQHKQPAIVARLARITLKDASFDAASQDLSAAYQAILDTAAPTKNWVPTLHWYGLNNQYHRWIKRFLLGDFGISLRDQRPVFDKVMDALNSTLIIGLPAIILAYLLAVPIGVWSALKKGSKADSMITLLLFMLYSMPVFWIGTMLLIFFTTPAYGMDWFASIGLGSLPQDAPFWSRFWDTASHAVLPVFCLTYPSLAFIARQMKGSMEDVLQQQYILTAQAKGLPTRSVVWRHAFRNALFPLITILGSVVPSLIAGSVIIEAVFNIQGMGKLLLDSIQTQDWPVVYAILMFGAILTMLGILLADLLYALFDPRISY